MKIVIIRYGNPQYGQMMAYNESHVKQIKSMLPDAQVHIIDGIKDEVNKHLPDTDILLFSPFDYREPIDFSTAKELKWIHVPSAGAGVIISMIKNTSILLTNSSGVHPIPIAEHVFTFILMFTRQFHLAHRNQIEAKQWKLDGISNHLREAYQSTIGIVGFGRIGKRVAQLAKGFDMKVLVLSHTTAHTNEPNVDAWYPQEQRNVLLQQSDFVVNCLPHTKETEAFFSKKEFMHMKSSAYFINIGRGKTVIEEDLIQALKKGTIAGAGLDVFEEEPLPAKSELWNLPNVILTPHYAGWTPEYSNRVIDIFCHNLQGYITNSVMPTLVDKEKGY